MKLTEKDKMFLEKLKGLMQENDVWVEMKNGDYKRLVLRGNYGDKISSNFNMTRQGVRWRFSRMFNEIYVSAYETIYFIETIFGSVLRNKAIEIARERIEIRKRLKCRER